MKPCHFPNTVKRRQEDALKRKEERSQRSAQEQLKRLDQLFGPGQGAKKERERLSKVK